MGAARRVNGFILAGVVGLFTCGSMLAATLVQVLGDDPGNHWTHVEMARGLDRTRGEVELRVGDELLGSMLGRGEVELVRDGLPPSKLREADILVRLNHWNEVRAEIASWGALEAFVLGVSVALLAFGLRELRRRESPPR